MSKKEKIIDLIVIMLISGLALAGYMICTQAAFPGLENNESISIVLRVLLVGFLAQFGLAGMGISVVCLYRKDSFINHGLQRKNLLISVLLYDNVLNIWNAYCQENNGKCVGMCCRIFCILECD